MSLWEGWGKSCRETRIVNVENSGNPIKGPIVDKKLKILSISLLIWFLYLIKCKIVGENKGNRVKRDQLMWEFTK